MIKKGLTPDERKKIMRVAFLMYIGPIVGFLAFAIIFIILINEFQSYLFKDENGVNENGLFQKFIFLFLVFIPLGFIGLSIRGIRNFSRIRRQVSGEKIIYNQWKLNQDRKSEKEIEDDILREINRQENLNQIYDFIENEVNDGESSYYELLKKVKQMRSYESLLIHGEDESDLRIKFENAFDKFRVESRK